MVSESVQTNGHLPGNGVAQMLRSPPRSRGHQSGSQTLPHRPHHRGPRVPFNSQYHVKVYNLDAPIGPAPPPIFSPPLTSSPLPGPRPVFVPNGRAGLPNGLKDQRSFSQENMLDSESGYGSAPHPAPGREQGSPSERRAKLRKSHSSDEILRSPAPPAPPLDEESLPELTCVRRPPPSQVSQDSQTSQYSSVECGTGQYSSVQCGTVAPYSQGQPSQERRQETWLRATPEGKESSPLCSPLGPSRRQSVTNPASRSDASLPPNPGRTNGGSAASSQATLSRRETLEDEEMEGPSLPEGGCFGPSPSPDISSAVQPNPKETTGINQNPVEKSGSSPLENNVIGAKPPSLNERNNSSVGGLGSDAEDKKTEVWSTTDEEESAKLDVYQEEVIRDVYQEDAVRDVHQEEKVSLKSPEVEEVSLALSSSSSSSGSYRSDYSWHCV